MLAHMHTRMRTRAYARAHDCLSIRHKTCARVHIRTNVRAQQMGSQCGRRERLWPSSLDASLDVTSVANAYRTSREALISIASGRLLLRTSTQLFECELFWRAPSAPN